MLKLAALIAAVLGFGLLVFTYDRNRRAELQQSAVTRATAWILSAVGGISLLFSGLASILDFGVLFGLVAWVGWLAMGALTSVVILALVVSRIASEESASQRAPALYPRRPAVTAQARAAAQSASAAAQAATAAASAATASAAAAAQATVAAAASAVNATAASASEAVAAAATAATLGSARTAQDV
jgi:predicted lipid-binding transport protein (Tim44 family)